MRCTASSRSSWRCRRGTPRSYIDGPSRSSSRARRSMSASSSRTQPSPSARRRTVASSASFSASRGGAILSTTAVPSAVVASTTSAFMPKPSHERPIASDHCDAISLTRSGRASSHACSPAAVRALRSDGGMSIVTPTVVVPAAPGSRRVAGRPRPSPEANFEPLRTCAPERSSPRSPHRAERRVAGAARSVRSNKSSNEPRRTPRTRTPSASLVR